MNLDNIDPNIIDWNIALQQANQKQDLAIKMLKMLIDCLPEHQTKIDAAYQIKDYDAMYEEVHKLHGALCYCGTPRLKKVTKELEQAAQDKQRGATNKLYKQLNAEIVLLMDTYKKMESED